MTHSCAARYDDHATLRSAKALISYELLQVPILTVFMNFSLKRATPLSNIIIVGGGISNCAFNFIRAHPEDSTRPVIDFDLSIMMIPMASSLYLHKRSAFSLLVNLTSFARLYVIATTAQTSSIFGCY